MKFDYKICLVPFEVMIEIVILYESWIKGKNDLDRMSYKFHACDLTHLNKF